MKQKEIISLVQARTERKASGKGSGLDMNLELLCAMQDFIREKEWDWRFNSVVFSTVQGQNEYKLTDDPINLKDTAGPVTISRVQDGVLLDKVIDFNAKARLLNGVTPNTPKQWFQKPGDHDTVVINTPDAAVQLRVIYDCIPGSLPQDESIPLIPDHVHGLLADKLELKALKYLLGAENEKYQAASAEYQEKLSKA